MGEKGRTPRESTVEIGKVDLCRTYVSYCLFSSFEENPPLVRARAEQLTIASHMFENKQLLKVLAA
eukprot:2635371-Heterocapsa_arctica.AAC.1